MQSETRLIRVENAMNAAKDMKRHEGCQSVRLFAEKRNGPVQVQRIAAASE
jgi:hypothetical protein